MRVGRRSRGGRALCAAALLLAARPAGAQGVTAATPAGARRAVADSAERGPRFAYGLKAGAVSAADHHDEAGLGAVVEYHPTSWLVAAVNPSVARTTDTLGTTARTGFTDLGVSLGSSRAFDAAWAPSVGLSAAASLPTGDAAAGFGAGRVTESLYASAGIAPADRLALRGGAWHSLTYGAGQLAGTSVTGEASVVLTPGTSLGLSYGGEVGGAGIEVPGREIGGGITRTVFGSQAMTLEASHTLAGNGPRWNVTVAIGSAYAGLNVVGATSPVARFAGALARATNAGRGRGNGSPANGTGKGKTGHGGRG